MGKTHPDCINASNPYHECVDYCHKKIAEAKERADAEKIESEKDAAKKLEERTVHPDCVNASNPYHECSEYCFRKIVEAKEKLEKDESGMQEEDGAPYSSNPSHQNEVPPGENAGASDQDVQTNAEEGYPHLNERQKKLFELRLKMNEARKANQMAMVAEKKKQDPPESRGISKQKWMEERKKKIGKLLDSNGLDMSKAYMLDTQEKAEEKYKKWEKEPAPSGWDVFNQKTLYNAYKKRTKNIDCDMEAYTKAKEADPEFYRDASSLQYGKIAKMPEENVDRMVKELQDKR
ncbi:uncharacterized protein A4U43_C08F720 [Asparagus officinalis]|uniref:uncharacterized protein LOC109819488 n=1 Tax=Asparagus officinalis TaxID=4686 RepID=UPI00098E12F8|nr:uncharacterized protein LOC109819488 [Asparagus officinalis]ONK58884.1 uncharacterized protein A4U43_C08F720 [Asparagus officinalis]